MTHSLFVLLRHSLQAWRVKLAALSMVPVLLGILSLPVMLAVPNLALAGTAQNVAADPVLEKRVLALSETLRCLVCQNQTIADSHADLAIDLRNQVREKMAAGWSDQQVLDYMVQRYGDFVLYKPPVKGITWLLWFGPFALFFCALGFLLFKLKKQQQEPEPSTQDLQRAQQLLGSTDVADPVNANHPDKTNQGAGQTGANQQKSAARASKDAK